MTADVVWQRVHVACDQSRRIAALATRDQRQLVQRSAEIAALAQIAAHNLRHTRHAQHRPVYAYRALGHCAEMQLLHDQLR